MLVLFFWRRLVGRCLFFTILYVSLFFLCQTELRLYYWHNFHKLAVSLLSQAAQGGFLAFQHNILGIGRGADLQFMLNGALEIP